MALSEEDLLAMVKTLAQEFPQLSPKECRESLDELCQRVVEFCKKEEDLTPDLCKGLLTLVLSIVAPRCADQRPLQYHSLEIVGCVGRCIAKSEGGANDLIGFFFKLGKKEAKSQRMWKPKVLVPMLQYILGFAKAVNLQKVLGDAAFNFDAVGALMQALYAEMGRCEMWSVRWRFKASRALAKVLCISPRVLDHAITCIKKDDPPALLVDAVGSCLNQESAHRSPMLELYLKYILEAKQPASDYKLDAWGSIVSLMQAEEFEKQFLPVAVRMVKRQPAAIAHSMPALVKHLKIDLAPHIKEILDPLVVEISKVQEKRIRGKAFARQVVQKSSDLAAPLTVAESWAEALKKAGKTDEKQAVLFALTALVGALPDARDAGRSCNDGLGRLADAKGPLVKVASEEANEDSRALGCRALGAVLLQLPEAAAGPVAEVMLKILADKKAPDRAKIAVLETLGELLADAESMPAWCAGALEKSVPLVAVASTKAVLRLQSLLAWSVCGAIAGSEPDRVSSSLKKEHTTILKDGPSFLNAVPTILKAPYGELVAQAQLWCSILCGNFAGLPSLSAAANGLDGTAGPGAMSLPPKAFSEVLPYVRTAVVLLAALHRGSSSLGERPEQLPKPRERIGLLLAVQVLPASDSDHLLLLLSHAFVSWLADMSAMPRNERQVSSAALRECLIDLCEAVSASEKTPSVETLALLALAAHHPLIGTRAWPLAKVWKLLRMDGPLGKALQRAPSTVWQSLRELICAALKLPAKDQTGFRSAAIKLAGSFNLGAAETKEVAKVLRGEIEALVDVCCKSLHSEEVGKEKDNNVSVFFHQEGVLWMEEGTYVAEEREEKNLKKNKFLKDLYGDDDDLALEKKVVAPKPASKTAAKPGAKSKASAKGKAAAKGKSDAVGARGGPAGAMTGSEIQEAKIAEQSETRMRIRTYVDEAEFALDVLAALARHGGNSIVFEEMLPELVPHFLLLLKSALTVMTTRRSLRSIVSLVVSRQDVRQRDLLPDALQVVAKTWMTRTASAAGTPGEIPACDAVLDSVTRSAPLPMAAFSLVLPVVLRTLVNSGSAIQDLCVKALGVLEKQLELGATVPESLVFEAFDALSTALLGLKGQQNAVHAALLATGKYLVSSKEELARLASMFFSEDDNVRSTVIDALAQVQHNQNFLDEELDVNACRAVLTLGSLDEKTKEVAEETIEALGLESDHVLLTEIIDFSHTKTGLDVALQTLIAKAVSQVLQELEDADASTTALDMLMQLFRQDSAARTTVARCLEQVFKDCLEGEEQVTTAFKFLLRQALGIASEHIDLRDILLAAGIALIEKQGEEHAEVLLDNIEKFEDSGASTAAGESARLGVAVFLGALSKHLEDGNPKVAEILPRLLQRLLDPSSTESVQNAIVKVMPPLMKRNKEQANEQLVQLMQTALKKGTVRIVRRGAAMGLGAAVAGLRIPSISEHNVIKNIESASDDKDKGVREGAMMCLEGLTLSLGKLFDPYVVASLPLVQKCFSDSDQVVREASKVAAGAMMSQLSGPGVKQVLKPLLDGIKDKQWRTKLGSIELLASMTNCVPKQLTACLPSVVPALCGVINDQHAKVKDAAGQALERIGQIITSPELRVLAPDLIEALTDGAQFEHITKRVLDKLLSTSFVHHIDAPSLSLVCPLVQRALKERSAEMKRKGAQIVGSMVLLIKDAKDIQPYLPLLLPQLKVTLVDPIPDVRATAAKAFGVLANSLPEDMLGDVLPWLFNMLRSSESAVERSGAAHGLSEVLMAMGTERIEMLLPDILSNASNKDAAPEVREGYIGLFVYLPVAMGAAFEDHLEDTITALLNGLSDDNAAVRDMALKAAQVLTKHFGASHTALLLGPLEDGVFDVDWRIRHASVQLMGQLIEQILRAHRIPIMNAELINCDVLPKEWRCHMLASLYIVRSDENQVVKTACAQVWKAVVQNTPRTLKELLPALMKRLIANLASTNREKQKVAARCVGDLVGKLGERVMPELMPIFMNTLSTGDAHVREGVCIGLAELISATSKQLLTDYLGDLIPAIRQAIIDDEEAVRNSASTVVALLHGHVGSRATTDVVKWVLEQLSEGEVEENGDLFLNGLEQLLSKQQKEVLPIVRENLISIPDGEWTTCQVKGLASICVVSDAHLVHKHLSDFFPVIIKVASSEDSTPELREAAYEAADRLMRRVESPGLTFLVNELVAAAGDKEDSGNRAVGARLIEMFYEDDPTKKKADATLDVVSVLSDFLPVILPIALADTDTEALETGIRALNGIVKRCKKEELAPYLSVVRQEVYRLVTNPDTQQEDMSKLLPGLCHKNGLEPLYPIYQHGLMFGSAEVRESAAKGLGELVNHTNEAALKPYVVKITGPLIRIVGDKFPGSVKKAIVDTLKSLLMKGGVTLKPFLPQLQTTYVKCLADPTEAVRQKAAESLGTLVRLSARTEPLVNELMGGMVTNADGGARLAMLHALGEVLFNVPQPLSDKFADTLPDTLLSKLREEESTRGREHAAFALAMFIRRHAPEERAISLLQDEVVPMLEDADADTRYGGARTLAAACWCQEPQLKAPAADLAGCLQSLVGTWLPALFKDSESTLLSAAGVLLAGAAQLNASSSLPLSTLSSSVSSLAGLLSAGAGGSGKLNASGVAEAILAARHYGTAVHSVGDVDAAAAKLAAAVVARGADKGSEELVERAMAALLGLSAEDDASGVTSAVEKLTGKLDDKAAAKALQTYVKSHIKAILQYSAEADSGWNF